MAEVGSAFLSIIPSVRGIRGQLESQMGPEADAAGKTAGTRFGSSFKGAFAALAVTGAATAFVSFMGDSARAASDLNETMNKSKVIFGENSAAMTKWASGAARNLGLSKQEALASAAGFGDMFSQIGFGGKAAAAMSKQVVQMSADLGSFNNLPTADVAERMSAAFRGEYDSLQQVIPNINAARVEQVALATTGKTAAKELTAQEKAAAVLAIVHKDGARAMGDFAKTSGDQANASKIAKASLQDLKATIGTALLPALTNLAKAATPAFEWMSKHQGTVTAFAAVIGVLLVGAFVAWTASIIAANIALLANPITWIIAAIVLLVAAVVLIVKHWDLIKEKTVAVWGAIKSFLAGVWDGIKAKAAALWEGLKTAVSSAWDSIKTTVSTKAQQLLALVVTLGQKFLAAWLFLPKKMLQIGTDIVMGLVNGIKAAWHFVTDKVKSLIALIPLAIRKLMGIASPSKVMMRLGAQMSEGLALGITSGQPDIDASLRGLTARSATIDASIGGSSTATASDRPIYMDGTLFGWIVEIADGRAELKLNRASFEAGMRAYA